MMTIERLVPVQVLSWTLHSPRASAARSHCQIGRLTPSLKPGGSAQSPTLTSFPRIIRGRADPSTWIESPELTILRFIFLYSPASIKGHQHPPSTPLRLFVKSCRTFVTSREQGHRQEKATSETKVPEQLCTRLATAILRPHYPEDSTLDSRLAYHAALQFHSIRQRLHRLLDNCHRRSDGAQQ